MEVTRQNVDNLNAFLKIEIHPSDYNQQVKNQLEGIRKNARMPGFRKGMVPFSLIKKQYGQSVLLEKLNKIIDRSLSDYIKTNDLSLLGSPIQKEGTALVGDLENPDIFSCEFQIGLQPKIDLTKITTDTYDYYRVFIDDKLIDDYINDIRRRYGTMRKVDRVTKDSMIIGHLIQLNEDHTVTEGGVFTRTFLVIDGIGDSVVKASFIGQENGRTVIFDASNVVAVKETVLQQHPFSEEEWQEIAKNFQFSIEDIQEIELPELDLDFFNKIYGEGSIESEEQFRAKITENLTNTLNVQSEDVLLFNVKEKVLENNEISLPEEFLKKMMQLDNPNSSQELTDEEFQRHFNEFKWDIVRFQLLKEYKMTVQDSELINLAKLEVTRNIVTNTPYTSGYFPSEEEINAGIKALLDNPSERNNMFIHLSNNKLLNIFKDKFVLNEVEIPYDEFKDKFAFAR